MNRILKYLTIFVVGTFAVAVLGAAWFLKTRQPVRSGELGLAHLTAPVTVRYDERGVPHIRAENQADLYRALGYVQAQDRLFQMELVRRLSRGELAEILGPKLVEVDRMFRALGIRTHADAYMAKIDKSSPAYLALLAYLDGINQYQDTRAAPVEFAVLGISKRPFTPEDAMSVLGYVAYTFAATLRTEPPLSFIRDKLGKDYLKIFDLEWHPEGVLAPPEQVKLAAGFSPGDWQDLAHIGRLSLQVLDQANIPLLEGSNAWSIAGSRTASGKPLLAGDPHISFSTPAFWYEAHLSAPGFELYGHHQPLNPLALLGHNKEFGWSLTMFENDDMDLIAEKINPANPNQVWYHGQWVDMQSREETIAVKGGEPVKLVLRRSPHGPIVNDALGDTAGKTPMAMWWAFLETENPVLDAMYELNRANTLAKARGAASKIHSPGVNIMWANSSGDIGWWAAGKLPKLPTGVNPVFILDGSKPESDKLGFYPFSDNPQEENPARGYIVSANHQPKPASGVPVPGYYVLPDRVQRLEHLLSDPAVKWDTNNTSAVQLDIQNGYAARVLKPLLPVLKSVVTDPADIALLDQLLVWKGDYPLNSVAATVFSQFNYELAVAAMADELGDTDGAAQFRSLLRTRALEFALPSLAADESSPWWDNKKTPVIESRADTLKLVWRATLAHLTATFGQDRAGWLWGKAHTVTHGHPLGKQKPLDKLFDVGPFAAPGGRETPNNLSGNIGPAPWAVSYGPSTRRIIDFADVGKSVGINPVGQSGVLFDVHYSDQAENYMRGGYVQQYLDEADVVRHTKGTLTMKPSR